MSSRLERHKKRKILRKSIKQTSHIQELPSSADILAANNSTIDEDFIEKILGDDRKPYDFSVSDDEVKFSLELLDKQFTKDKYEALFDSSKEVLLDQLLKPFKLSREDLAAGDVEGGPVTTTHNFSKGVTANDNDQQKYQTMKESKAKFDRKPYEDKTFKYSRKQELQKGKLTDGYTGKEIPKDGRSHLDHITSAQEIETDSTASLAMSRDDKIKMANSPENLTMTDSALNQSKGKEDLQTWLNKKNAQDKSKSNADFYGVDEKLAEEKYQESKTHIHKTTKKAYTKKVVSETLSSSASAAKDVGLQQAVGVLMSEFISAIFFEVKDFFNSSAVNQKYHQSWFEQLKFRLNRMKTKLLSKWKDVAKAFAAGALSGFLSNIITVVTNAFITTGKKIIRLIREGFTSLMKAMHLLLSPPENMTFKQAAHEASKVLAAGLAVTGGIMLGELIMNSMPPFLPFQDTISVVLSGLISGLGSLFVVFMLDKLDVFGINRDERHKYIMGELEVNIENKHKRIDHIIENLGLA